MLDLTFFNRFKVRGVITVSTQSCNFSLFLYFPNRNHILLDSRRNMLYYDINHVNVGNEIELHNKREFNFF